MAHRVLPIGLVAVSVLVAATIGLVLLLRGGTNEAEAGLLPPIHYKCYQIPQGAAPTPQVTLETQFGVEKNVSVVPTQREFLCPPAVKTYNGATSGDLNQPHLKCYSIQSADNPPHVVNLTDQFGTQTNVAVGQAVLLCMPVLKAIAPGTPTGTLPTVPHYKCYSITDTTPSHTVTLDTQFGTENNVTVMQAQLLCAPAIKTRQVVGALPEGNLNAAHLKCYQITGPAPVPTIFVNLHTQFGDENNVPVQAPQMLCQAVIKTIVTPQVHYKCYDLPALVPPQPLNVLVGLQTQFGPDPSVRVTDAKFLCPPALKTHNAVTTGDLNATHLKCYDIVSTEVPIHVVTLTDQFTTQTGVQVGLPKELCVPAAKEVLSPQPAPPGPLATTPHYKCYEINGPPPGATVDLRTQFGFEPGVPVGPAIRLCAPALKTIGAPAVTYGDLSAPHLKCYQIPTGPPPGFMVNLTTQFSDPLTLFGHENNVQVGPPERLCVPVTKTVTLPTPTPSPSPSPTPPPLTNIHYKCYDITPQTLGVQVDLRTQFGFEQAVRVTTSKFLCPPVVKTIGVQQFGDLNGPHLKCYDIQSTLTPANEDPIQVVTLTDQFISQPNVSVGLARELCVPALKAIPPNPLSGTLPTQPHYKCYEITGAMVNITGVKLETQFGIENPVTVVQADRLCAPAIKTFGGVNTGNLNNPHLVCYVITPHISVSRVVNLLTQFGVETNVGVTFNERLCVPATKTVTFPTPTPSPSPSPSPSPVPTPTPVHYKCYDIVGPPLDITVRLKTQFRDEPNVIVMDPTSLCPPALKSVINPPPGHGPEGDLNATHLKCYNIQSTDNPNRVVKLTDQFLPSGSNVIVGPARELCVPALKAVLPNPLPVGAQPPTVPHYKCYDITGPAPGFTVVLQTQFSHSPTQPNETVQVGPAIRLCAPALKTIGAPAVTYGDLTAPHLKCYQITDTPPSPLINVNLRTQFGDELDKTIGAAEELCVPAVKSVVCVTIPPWVTPAGDFDCDGFPSVAKVGSRGSEGYIGTLPDTACAVTIAANDEPLPDAWPVDNNDSRKANLSDVLAYIPVYGLNVPPGPARFDINEDGKIGLADILLFIPFFGLTC